jgi:hypothetical protein
MENIDTYEVSFDQSDLNEMAARIKNEGALSAKLMLEMSQMKGV